MPSPSPSPSPSHRHQHALTLAVVLAATGTLLTFAYGQTDQYLAPSFVRLNRDNLDLDEDRIMANEGEELDKDIWVQEGYGVL